MGIAQGTWILVALFAAWPTVTCGGDTPPLVERPASDVAPAQHEQVEGVQLDERLFRRRIPAARSVHRPRAGD